MLTCKLQQDQCNGEVRHASLLRRRAGKQTSLQTPSGHGTNAISRCCATRSGRQRGRSSSCAAVSSSWPTGPKQSSACRCGVPLKPLCFAWGSLYGTVQQHAGRDTVVSPALRKKWRVCIDMIECYLLPSIGQQQPHALLKHLDLMSQFRVWYMHACDDLTLSIAGGTAGGAGGAAGGRGTAAGSRPLGFSRSTVGSSAAWQCAWSCTALQGIRCCLGAKPHAG